jgi:hypothetical protein
MTAVRSTSAKGIYFTTFDIVSRSLTNEGDLPSLLSCFVAGGIAGGAAWALNYPTDVIKSKI